MAGVASHRLGSIAGAGVLPPSFVSVFLKLVAGARIEHLRGGDLRSCCAGVLMRCDQLGYVQVENKLIRYAFERYSEFNMSMSKGYCYLWMIKPEWRLRAMVALGPSPTLMSMASWQVDDAWDYVRWSGLVIQRGGLADYHVDLKGSSDVRGVDLNEVMGRLMYVDQFGLLQFRSQVVVEELGMQISKYSSVGAGSVDLADEAMRAYAAMPFSVEDMMQGIVSGRVPAIVASLYAGSQVDQEVMQLSQDGGGKAVVCLPKVGRYGAYLLPPGYFYSGSEFKVGSLVMPTVMIVPEGVGFRVSCDISRFRARLNVEKYRLAFLPAIGLFKSWCDGLHVAGVGSEGHFVRTQADVLIHDAIRIEGARSAYVEVSDPLDQYKSIEVRRYEGRVKTGRVKQVGCDVETQYSVVTGFRTDGNAALIMCGAVEVSGDEPRIALPGNLARTVAVVGKQYQGSGDVRVKLKSQLFSFHVELVADSYSYDNEYDSEQFDSDGMSSPGRGCQDRGLDSVDRVVLYDYHPQDCSVGMPPTYSQAISRDGI